MKPKPAMYQAQREMSQVELEQLVDAGHPLVHLGRQITDQYSRSIPACSVATEKAVRLSQ